MGSIDVSTAVEKNTQSSMTENQFGSCMHAKSKIRKRNIVKSKVSKVEKINANDQDNKQGCEMG